MGTISKKLTFNTFNKTNENLAGFEFANKIATDPGSYNPIFIYGRSGSGKTHLVQAIANTVLKNNPNKKLLYKTAHEMSKEYVDSLRKNTLEAFYGIYKDCDFLIIDDIESLKDKEKTQEEFLALINEFILSERQIIFTSTSHPNLKGFSDKLNTRFSMGTILEMR